MSRPVVVPHFAMSEVSYELAAIRWRRSDTIDVLTIHDTQIAVFPLAFLSSCGDNTWQYVLNVVHQLVTPIPERPGVIVTEMGEPVNLEEPPSAGTFRYKQPGALLLPTDLSSSTDCMKIHSSSQGLTPSPPFHVAPSISAASNRPRSWPARLQDLPPVVYRADRSKYASLVSLPILRSPTYLYV
jgi:hypothetical protein